MKSIKEILNINLDNNLVRTSQSNFLSIDTLQSIGRSKRQLREIENKSKAFVTPNLYEAAEIYNKFIGIYNTSTQSLDSYFNTNTRIRKLCASLDYPEGKASSLIMSDLFESAFNLISNRFRNSFFNILFYLLLKYWISIPQSNKLILIKFLKKKVTTYQGKKIFINSINKNLDYFLSDEAPSSLSSATLFNKWKLSELLERFELPSNFLQTEFFSEVADLLTDSICRQSGYDIGIYVDELIKFLQLHKNIDTTKKCFSTLIIKIDRDNNLNENVKTFAFRLIGDPADDFKWFPWDKKEETQEKIQKARMILNNWINREILELFFHKITMDRDRKKFWLDYYKKATKLKIFGPPSLLSGLKKDVRISSYVDERFGILVQSGSQCALVMLIKNYVFVEFSTKGTAFYAYKIGNKDCPDFSSRRITKSGLVKPYKMKNLLRKSGYHIYETHPEGRFTHFTDWQYSLKNWMKKYLDI